MTSTALAVQPNTSLVAEVALVILVGDAAGMLQDCGINLVLAVSEPNSISIGPVPVAP